jgi:hypothetical protein
VKNETGSTQEQIMTAMCIKKSTSTCALASYATTRRAGKLRKRASKLQKEATRLGTIDQWNKDEQRKTIHVNGVEMLAIPY